MNRDMIFLLSPAMMGRGHHNLAASIPRLRKIDEQSARKSTPEKRSSRAHAISVPRIEQIGKQPNSWTPKSATRCARTLGKVLRWFLMILGLLFSDAVAWVVSAIAHHQMSLPIPFLTVGAVGAILSFLGAFRIPRL